MPRADTTLAPQAALVERWRAALERTGGAPVECIETHISWVLLSGGRAYKLMKALRTPFLDASTLALRRHHAEEALRLDGRLAPQLYIGLGALTGSADAPALKLDPAPGDIVLEWVLVMRAFDPQATWDRRIAREGLPTADIDGVAATLAAFQTVVPAARPGDGFGTPERIQADWQDSLQALHDDIGPHDGAAGEHLAALDAWARAAAPRLGRCFARRLAEGRVREGHGDLHLGNVVDIDGRPTLFDGIDFNPGLRWIDTASDMAFLAMDLAAHGHPGLGHRAVNAWLEAGGDYDAVRVLDFYRAYRALVRAKVAAMRAGQRARQRGGPSGGAGLDDAARERARAAHYLAVARAMVEPVRCGENEAGEAIDGQRIAPALLITHGPSGSGKTTLTQGLVECAAAVRIRSDVERKRLAGLPPLTTSRSPLHGGLYSAEIDEQVLEHLFEAARAVIDGGRAAILDATFLRRAPREAARDLAQELGVPLRILHLVAGESTLRERVRARRAHGSDASEADVAVLDEQLRTAQSLRPSEWAVAYNVQALPGSPGAVPQVEWAPLLAQLRSTCPPGS